MGRKKVQEVMQILSLDKFILLQVSQYPTDRLVSENSKFMNLRPNSCHFFLRLCYNVMINVILSDYNFSLINFLSVYQGVQHKSIQNKDKRRNTLLVQMMFPFVLRNEKCKTLPALHTHFE